MRASVGFTLAELLIALAVLGVIATFAIPKVLTSQQDSQYRAIAKEAAGAISGAYQDYKQRNGTVPITTDGSDILQSSLNYIRLDSTGAVDDKYSAGSATTNCTNSAPCYRLASGGTIRPSSVDFNGTGTLNTTVFIFDPDSIVTTGSTTGPGKSVEFWLYYNGRLATRGTLEANTTNSSGTYSADPTKDPPWFGWD